ncbi:MAG: response regulator transcription factor [Candidatus Methanoperedens sp.]|nr:MAG: response regulator transcription factor [Candidatus Methanoperedens sp.]
MIQNRRGQSISEILKAIGWKQCIKERGCKNRNEFVLGQGLTPFLVKGLLTAQALQKLTKREREILLLVVSGFTSKKIAEKLFISDKTVETHRMRMMHKLGIHKTADLVRYAITSGLLDTSLSNHGKQN